MRGQNLGLLWDAFGGKYLTNRHEVAKILGIGNEKAGALLADTEVLAIGKGVYYRVMDVIDAVENGFAKR